VERLYEYTQNAGDWFHKVVNMLSRPNADIDVALREARAGFAAKRPKSQAVAAEAERYMPGGNTRSVLYHGPFPVRAVSGEGATIVDADGHRYVNLNGEHTAGIYGHSHPVIKAAVAQALDNGFNLAAHNLYEIELARLICERFKSIELVRFTNSGTEANLLAIAIARKFTGRSKVIAFKEAYHGGVLHFAGGGLPINAPFPFVLAEYNRLDAARQLIRTHAGDLACVIVEPMIGSGGCIPGELAFLRMLRDETSRAGALLIFDEVMTSRFKAGGAQGLWNIAPDLTTLGKYIGGGMTFGAFGGRADVMTLFDPRQPGAMPHAGTFNNNVVTMSAGIAGLSKVFTPDVAAALHDRGDEVRNRLNDLFAEMNAKLTATGVGSIMMIHIGDHGAITAASLRQEDQRLRQLLSGIFHRPEAVYGAQFADYRRDDWRVLGGTSKPDRCTTFYLCRGVIARGCT
jgi:glutamate-1-semialdehyde 2,1-aminomutase